MFSKFLSSPIKARLAPTPSGRIHWGNALNFILNASVVHLTRGQLHLRIDDFDVDRFRLESIEDIFKLLDILKIIPDSGPSHISDYQNNYQTNPDKQKLLLNKIFQFSQEKIYPCDCSRAQIFKRHPKGLYMGTCRGKKVDSSSKHFSWRMPYLGEFSTPILEFPGQIVKRPWNEISGDILLKRSDGPPSSHAYSVLMDHEAEINLIIRGLDLLESSLIQETLLQQWPEDLHRPKLYFHHGLLIKGGQKISKSKGSPYLLENLGKDLSGKFIYQTIWKILAPPWQGPIPETLEQFSNSLAAIGSWNFLKSNIDLGQFYGQTLSNDF